MSCTNEIRNERGRRWLAILTGDLNSESAQQVLAEARALLPGAAAASDQELAEVLIDEILKLPAVCPDCDKGKLS